MHTHTHAHAHTCTHSLDHEDLSDDEVWEIVEDEVSEEEDEEREGAALPSRCRTFTSPDSSVRPSSRLLLYDSPEWRMEVSGGVKGVDKSEEVSGGVKGVEEVRR